MKSRRVKNVIFLLAILLFVLSLFIYRLSNSSKEVNIDNVLRSNDYSYLPKEAIRYIKEVYENSGEIVLTEKNKKKNEPYLNPQFVEYLVMSEEEKKELEVIPFDYVIDYVEVDNRKEESSPSTYNLENVNGYNYLTPFKNQQSLGVCWAFATVENAETFLMKESNTSYNSNIQTFSVRQIDYATSIDGLSNYDNFSDYGYRDLGSGGNTYMANTILADGVSLIDDSYLPYNTSLTKKPVANVLSYIKSSYELNSSVLIPELEEGASSSTIDSYVNDIKSHIIQYGGPYVGTFAPEQPCSHTDNNGNSIIRVDGTCTESGGHAMQIIGWNDNYSYSYCTVNNTHYASTNSICNNKSITNGTGVWILRNSWGASHTYRYAYLAYDSLKTSISFITSLTSSSNRAWDNVYHENPYNPYTSGGNIYLRNIVSTQFDKKIDTKEKIEKVKFFAFSSGTYKVSIYTSDKSYENVMTLTTSFGGINTFDLSDKNIYIDDSSFNVRVSSSWGYIIDDTISVFTSNEDETPIIKMDDLRYENELRNETSYEIDFIAETKNIPSNSIINYSLFKNDEDKTSYLSVTNNDVSLNKVLGHFSINGSIGPGVYTLKSQYESTIVESKIYLGILSQSMIEGNGTINDPYLIYDEVDFNFINYKPYSYYSVQSDFEFEMEPLPITFGGYIDGNNHVISNISISSSSAYRGLFNTVTNSSGDAITIKNLTIKDANVVNGDDKYGSLLIGKANLYGNINIENIYLIDGRITAGKASSLIGNIDVKNSNVNININKVFSSVDMYGIEQGGLIGESVLKSDTSMNINNIQFMGDFIQNKVFNNTSASYLFSTNTSGNITINNLLLTGNIRCNNYDNCRVLNINQDNIEAYYTDNYLTINDGVVKKSIQELTNADLYATWENFDANWVLNSNRIPILKGVPFEYTTVSDAQLEINGTINLFDLIGPNKEKAKDISYSITSGTNVISIDSNNNIKGLSDGIATIHIISNYDGYEGDITILVGNGYIISYNANNGTDDKKEEMSLEGLYTVQSNTFTKTGYKFSKWNTKADGTGNDYLVGDSLNVTGNVDLYAMWDKISYSIQYNSNGGDGSISNQEVKYDEDVILALNTFTRDKYEFSAWCTNQSGTGTCYEEGSVVSNLSSVDESVVTLYAKWEHITKTISYYANNGTDNNLIRTINLGSNYKIESNTFTKIGYKFSKWNTKEDGTGTDYNVNQQITVNESLVLFARWVPINYNIVYSSNGGFGNNIVDGVAYDIDYQIKSNTYIKDGYAFKYWNTKANGTGTTYRPGETVRNLTTNDYNNIYLYAIWESLTPYVINNYTVDEVNGVISGISVNTDINTFKSSIILGTGYSVVVETQNVNNRQVLYTGGKTRIMRGSIVYKDFTNAVTGEINGDGLINSADLLKVVKHLKGSSVLTGAYVTAADCNKDKTINSADLLKIVKFLKGSGTL